MHEEYRGDNGPETVYESDSMAKTATALLIGVLENRGLVDLDTPIIEYGVVPQANWSKNANRTDWFPHVTTRHLLGQTTGVGEVKPGTQFTYDSDAYLQVDAPPRATYAAHATAHAQPLGPTLHPVFSSTQLCYLAM